MRTSSAAVHRRHWLLRGTIGVIVAVVSFISATLAQRATQVHPSTARQVTVTPSSYQQAAVPPAPQDLRVAADATDSVVLSWQLPRILPVGYRIYRAIGHNPFVFIGVMSDGAMNSYIDGAALNPGTTFAYRVTAVNDTGESPPSSSVFVLVRGVVGPTATVVEPGPLPTFSLR